MMETGKLVQHQNVPSTSVVEGSKNHPSSNRNCPLDVNRVWQSFGIWLDVSHRCEQFRETTRWKIKCPSIFSLYNSLKMRRCYKTEIQESVFHALSRMYVNQWLKHGRMRHKDGRDSAPLMIISILQQGELNGWWCHLAGWTVNQATSAPQTSKWWSSPTKTVQSISPKHTIW